ncbi:MAG: ABC transporter permease [Bacteroidetes bacterium]|nr:ABC transporter permease [Bacteroidota bacterium]
MEIPKSIKLFLTQTGELAKFTGRFFSEAFHPHYEFREFIRQCYIIGYKSLPLLGITGFIMGLVLTMQLRPTLVDYGAESMLPSMISLSVVREIGPVITALIFAGKIGSSIGAELGSMRVTEQIDAMEVSGTNPYRYLVVTRVAATTVMLPLLIILSDAVGLYGGYLGVNIHAITSYKLYMTQAFNVLDFYDVLPAIIKTFFFGFAIGIIGCYKGYYSKKGTEGVGLSANSAVVISSLVIFILDLIAVQITGILGYN